MKKTLSLVLVLWLLLTTLTGCTQTSTTETKTVKVWVIAPLSGPAATYGEDTVNAYNMVVDEFNKKNKDLQIQLVFEDGKCDGKDATSAAQKLITVDKVQAIVWGVCSAETISAGKIAQANNVLMLSPVSSAPEVAEVGNYVFRYWNDAYVTKKLADYMNDQGIKKLAIIRENTDYPLWYANSLKKFFAGNVTLEEQYNGNEKDFSIIAKKVRNQINDIDALIFITSSDSNTIDLVKSFDKQGILETLKGRVFGTEVTTTDVVKQWLGDLLENIKLAQLVSVDELWKQSALFIENFKKAFEVKSTPLFVILEAEAMQTVLDAIKAKWNDGEAIRAYIAKYSASNPRKWIIGNYYFTDKRDASSLQFKVYQFKNSNLEVIE